MACDLLPHSHFHRNLNLCARVVEAALQISKRLAYIVVMMSALRRVVFTAANVRFMKITNNVLLLSIDFTLRRIYFDRFRVSPANKPATLRNKW